LECNIVGLNYLINQKKYNIDHLVVISPDAGGVARAKKFSELIKSTSNIDTC
jgi:phosphoribosylpyrophosphate synthetase